MKKIFVVFIAVLMGLTLIGCGAAKNGGGNAGNDTDQLKQEICGYYTIGWTEGDTTSEEDVKLVNEAGIEFSLTMNEDGTAVIVSNGTETNLEYDLDKMEMRSGSEVIKFTYESGTIHLTEGSEKVTFVKAD